MRRIERYMAVPLVQGLLRNAYILSFRDGSSNANNDDFGDDFGDTKEDEVRGRGVAFASAVLPPVGGNTASRNHLPSNRLRNKDISPPTLPRLFTDFSQMGEKDF